MTFRYTMLFFCIFLICTTSHAQFGPTKDLYMFSDSIQAKLERDTFPWKYQQAAFEFSLTGEYRASLEAWEMEMGVRELNYSQQEQDSLRKLYKVKPARDYILKQAAKTSVVIINEAHHVPRHRTFTTSLLQDLYDMGYRYLGLEALYHIDPELSERGYPIATTGHYIVEPQFGNMVREAMRIGYTLFPYEINPEVDGDRDREIVQAEKITGFMRANPDGKYLIHCGFDHAIEGEHAYWGQAMAARVSESMEIDPLTVYQPEFTPVSDPKYNRAMLKTFKVREPSVLVDAKGTALGFTRGNGYCDITVLHPDVHMTSGRPDWLLINDRQLVQIDLSSLQTEFPLMVRVYASDDDRENAVPVDIIEVREPADHAHVIVRPGEYMIDFEDTSGNTDMMFIRLED